MKKTLLLSTVALLVACGYKPLYQAGDDNMRSVVVEDVRMLDPDYAAGERRVAQIVWQQLKQSFPAKQGKHYLEVAIEEEEISLAVRRDATDLRRELQLRARIWLRDADGKEVLYVGEITKVPYNVEDSPFGTDAGRDYARQAGATELAREIQLDVARWQAGQDVAKDNYNPDAGDVAE